MTEDNLQVNHKQNLIKDEQKHHSHSHHHDNGNKQRGIMRAIISFFLSFLLSIILFITAMIAGIYIGVFNESVILNQLNKTNYYAQVQESIQSRMESIILPTGLPNSVLDNVITLQNVYINAKNYIEGNLRGETVVVNSKSMSNQLKENLESYMKEENIEATDETNQGMATLVVSAEKEYIRLLEFPFIQYYIKYKTMYKKVMSIAIPVLLALALVIITALIKMHRFKHKAVRYLAYSDLSTSIMLLVIPSIALLSGIYKKLHISPKYFYSFIVGYIKWDITVFIYLGAVGIALFIGLLAIIRNLRQRVS